MKIAVADDEQLLLSYMQKLVCSLEPEAQVDAFLSSAKLLEKAEHTRYDIAFLDIQMPGITGLELAKALKEKNEELNIIFVTGFDGYQGEAMDLFASGYVRKPATKEKIQQQLAHLRYPVHTKSNRIYAQTFGNFTLYAQGVPVEFARKKSQMAMAYLIHRRGALVSRKELSAVLFEDGKYDDNRRSFLSKVCSDLQSTLTAAGAENLVQITAKGLFVRTDMLDCDLYDFLNGKQGAKEKFKGEYMAQYSFGEDYIPYLITH